MCNLKELEVDLMFLVYKSSSVESRLGKKIPNCGFQKRISSMVSHLRSSLQKTEDEKQDRNVHFHPTSTLD